MIGRLKYDVVIGGGRVLMLNGCPFRMPIDPCGHLNWVLELVQGTKVIRLWPECLVSVEGIFGIRAFVRYWMSICTSVRGWNRGGCRYPGREDAGIGWYHYAVRQIRGSQGYELPGYCRRACAGRAIGLGDFVRRRVIETVRSRKRRSGKIKKLWSPLL